MLHNAMARLSPEEREIILPRDFQDVSYRDIGEVLELPPGTVMSRLFYARKKLAQWVGKENQ